MQEVYIYIHNVRVYVCSMCMCKHIQYVNVCVYAYLYVSLPRCGEWGPQELREQLRKELGQETAKLQKECSQGSQCGLPLPRHDGIFMGLG